MNYLSVAAAFEEWSHSDKADIVIPHYNVLGIMSWVFEDIAKHCKVEISSYRNQDAHGLVTFETLASRLLKEVLFATVVRDMLAGLKDASKRVDLEVFNLSQGDLVKGLKGGIRNMTAQLRFGHVARLLCCPNFGND